MCELNKKSGLNRIDPCIKEYIKFLDNQNLIVVACCCGHNKYKKTVVIERTYIDGKVKHFDLISGIEIPRKKKFYKKDKEGYYYIPEVVNKKNSTKENK